MKKLFSFAFAVLSAAAVLSCGKDNGNQGGETTKAQLGIEVKDAKAIYEVNQNESVNLELTVVANPTCEDALTITVAAKPALVATYNSKNGTSYQMLPTDAFTLTGTSVIMPRYSAKSSAFQLRLKGAGCDPEQTYVLPIAIGSVQGGTNFDAPDDKAAFIVFKMIATEEEGDGSKDKPFVIKEVDDLLKMGAKLQDESTTYFKLMADIDLKDVTFTEEKPWEPINAAETDDAKAAARKRKIDFDGNNKKISNFKADGPLFAIFCGSIKDLTIDGFQIDRDGDDAATLVGVAGASDEAEGFIMKNVKVTNSSVKVTPNLVTDPKRAAALVAYMRNGIVENCETACDVEALQQAGGIIGRAEAGTIKNCKASGSIAATKYYAGGLIGYVLNATITGCSASGNVSGDANYARSGGLVGEMHGGSIEKCFATGNVSGATGHFAGGLVGVADAEADITISKSYATGNVTYTGTGNKAGYGGLVGRTEKGTITITDCYSTGAIKAFRWSGGFVGDVNTNTKLTIKGGYTTSDISAIGPDGNGDFMRGLLIGSFREKHPFASTTVSVSKFIAWKSHEEDAFCNPALDKDNKPVEALPVEGNYYGNEGTVSSQATALGWDTTVWDLSGNEPKLK